uniref:Uncharacterized protein n=1 Tax=Corvus moneduloides TaxID=1196302 RepID=A0A8C3DAK1_CORMO
MYPLPSSGVLRYPPNPLKSAGFGEAEARPSAHPFRGVFSCRDPPVLPYLKQEEPNGISTSQPPVPAFQYVLCAPTSPAVRHHEETLTYLNQGQSYEIRMMGTPRGDPAEGRRMVKSVVRVVFHDRRLQYSEQQQLEGWRWSRPGDRILDIDIPVSVGILEPQIHPTLLNTVEFLWDPCRRTSVFVQVHCISTEFTLRKNGGEKGVPFRIQIDTFGAGGKGDPPEHLHSASCLVKVFKPKGADRKQKTDREKVEKQPAPEREKFQPAYESTVLAEVGPGPGTPRGPGVPRDPAPITPLPPQCPRPRLTLYVAREPGGAEGAEDAGPGLYQELHLEQLTVAELTAKLAELLGLPPGQILRLSRQGPAGIHVLVSDAVRARGQTEPAAAPSPGQPQPAEPGDASFHSGMGYF